MFTLFIVLFISGCNFFKLPDSSIFPDGSSFSESSYFAEYKVIDFYPCSGPDQDGLPLDKNPEISGEELEIIYICGYLESDRPVNIAATWKYEQEDTAFAENSSILVDHSGYVFFSLLEGVDHADKWLIGDVFRNKYIHNGYLPYGEYHVLISSGRNDLAMIDFIVK